MDVANNAFSVIRGTCEITLVQQGEVLESNRATAGGN